MDRQQALVHLITTGVVVATDPTQQTLFDSFAQLHAAAQSKATQIGDKRKELRTLEDEATQIAQNMSAAKVFAFALCGQAYATQIDDLIASASALP